MPHDSTLLIPLIGSLLALICLVAAQRPMRRYRLMQDLPTSKSSGVFIGMVELKGTAEAEQPLTSFLAEQRCVYYTWNVSEHWSRTVTETYRDSDGKTKTRMRHESGWTTVASGGESIPFYLHDDYGVVQIRPENAKIDTLEVFNESSTPDDELYYSKGPPDAILNSDHRRQFSEHAIPLHTELYVVGQARERADIVAAEIAYDSHAPMFVISVKPEGRLVKRQRWSLFWLLLVGLIVCGGAFILFGRLTQPDMPFNVAWLIPIVCYAAATAIAWLWTVYNSLLHLQNRMHQGWATIEIQLQRRHDLIPRLVQVVSALSDYEKDVQTVVAILRNQLRATPPGVAGPEYEAVSKQLVALSEKYPEITAQESFLRLQAELSETESRIALARGYYNEIVSYWNTRLQRVPDNLVAWLGRRQPRKLLEAHGFERENVKVVLAE